jgi:predicted ArsR family transcriptional regulator
MGQLSLSDRGDDRVLFQLKTRGPQTALAIGSRLSMTATGARQHLAKLEAAGLVASENRHQSRGRPTKYWRLTERGHGRFPDRHSDLTLEFLRASEAVFGVQGLERLVRHREARALAAYRRELSGRRTLRERLSRLAEIRSREGYMASVTEDAPGRFLLIEDHCPICAAAATCQGICRSELALFRKALGEEIVVERVDHILSGGRRCAYRVSRR